VRITDPDPHQNKWILSTAVKIYRQSDLFFIKFFYVTFDRLYYKMLFLMRT